MLTQCSRSSKIGDIMTKGVHRVYEDDDLKVAEQVMKVSWSYFHARMRAVIILFAIEK